MLKDDSMEQVLRDMSLERINAAYSKAKVTEEFAKAAEEEEKALEGLNLNPEQKQAYFKYEEALNSRESFVEHYIYLQGLRDGMTLSHVV